MNGTSTPYVLVRAVLERRKFDSCVRCGAEPRVCPCLRAAAARGRRSAQPGHGGDRVLVVELLAVQVTLGLLVPGFGAGQRAGPDRVESGVVDEPFGPRGRLVVVGG